MPQSRPMPSIGPGCHELRINDEDATWRVIYYLASDVVVVLEIFSKKTNQTPQNVIKTCQKRLSGFQSTRRGKA
jgi:phage-related protein